ncbi:hypothetical protein M514_13962, partial [Trichuris suis]
MSRGSVQRCERKPLAKCEAPTATLIEGNRWNPLKTSKAQQKRAHRLNRNVGAAILGPYINGKQRRMEND